MKKGLTFLLSGLLTVTSASAATYTWSGGSSGTWDTSSLTWNSNTLAWPTTNPSTTIASIGLGSSEALTIANNTTIYANGANMGNGSSLYSGNSFSKLVFTGATSTLDLGGSAIYWNANTEVATSSALSITNGSFYLGRRAGDGSAIISNFNANGQKVTSSLGILLLGVRTIGSGDVTALATFGSTGDSTLSVTQGGGVGILGAVNPYIGNLSGTLNLVGGTNTFTADTLIPVLRIGRVFGDNLTNTAAVSGILNISGGTTTVFHSGNSDAIILAQRDAGSANTTVTGLLNLTGGTLNVSDGDIYGGGGISTVTLNGGTLNLTGRSLGRSGGLITNLNFQSGTLSNVLQINNGAVLNKTTSGTLLLNGTNSYSGGTTLTLGTLQAGSNTALGSGALTLTAGKFSSDSTTARAISNAVTFGGDVTLGDATNTGALTFNGAGTLTGNRTITTASNVTYAGAIGETSGPRSLTKTGAGSLTFSAVNTYTGTTLVSGGTLILSGSGSIAGSTTVDVASGATLNTSGVTGGTYTYGSTQTVKGNGTIIGNSVIQGTLAAGNSPGLLTFSNDVTLTSSTNSVFEIENTGMVRGTDYDGVDVGGLLTYDGTLTLSMTNLLASGGTYNLFDFVSVAGNFDTVAFSGAAYAGTFAFNSGFWTATDTNGSGQVFSFGLASGDLIISAIPEPSTTLLLTGSLMALLFLRRRRA